MNKKRFCIANKWGEAIQLPAGPREKRPIGRLFSSTKEKSVKYDKDKDSDKYIDQIPSTTELYETLPTKYVINTENFEDSTEINSEGVWTSVQRIIFN